MVGLRVLLALLLLGCLGFSGSADFSGVSINNVTAVSDNVMTFDGWGDTASDNCEHDDTGRGSWCDDLGGRKWAQQSATIVTGSDCRGGSGECLEFDYDIRVIDGTDTPLEYWILPDWDSTSEEGKPATDGDGGYLSYWVFYDGGSAGASSFDDPSSSSHAYVDFKSNNNSFPSAGLKSGGSQVFEIFTCTASCSTYTGTALSIGPEDIDGKWVRIEVFVDVNNSGEASVKIYDTDGTTVLHALTSAGTEAAMNGSNIKESGHLQYTSDNSPQWEAPGTGQVVRYDDYCTCDDTIANCQASECASMQTP